MMSLIILTLWGLMCFWGPWGMAWMGEKEPRITAKEIQTELQGQGMSVSDRTIHHFLSECGLHGRRPRRTPLLIEKPKKARLEFSKMHIDKPQSFWVNVLWTDESKLELFGKSHQMKKRSFQRKEHHTHSEAWMRLFVLWGCFVASGTGCLVFVQGTMKSQDQSTLERNVLPSVRKLCLCHRSWVLQQDNDPKCTSKSTQVWIRTKHWTILKWPSMSPDLNPIEHLWKELKLSVWRRHSSTLRPLEQFAQEEWAQTIWTAAEVSLRATENIWMQWLPLKIVQQKY